MCMYFLSGRQYKELSRGVELSIVLPAPPDADGVADWTAWAAEHLELRSLARIASVASDWLVPVNPRARGVGVGGLGEIMGEIVADASRGWCVHVDCIIVDLWPVRSRVKSRGQLPRQWPGGVRLAGGQVLPGAAPTVTRG